MKDFYMDDTIAAIATPPGENGIGIIRISGPDALSIADKIFVSKRSKDRLLEFKSHSIHYGHIIDKGAFIDEVLITVMRAPKTYTTEDVVEINCHGGIASVREILKLILSSGARLGEPGEFTKRAFLNGRIDLMQAEAVSDIISSQTNDSLKVASHQLSGSISKKIKSIKAKLIDTAAEIEAAINFPGEDLETLEKTKIIDSLKSIESELIELLKTADQGRVLRNGIVTVICGKPNVGKSTLMNTFLKQDRVIVTPEAGTTRDSIEEIINVKGIPLRIVDTAGIIHPKDQPTEKSVLKSKHYMEIADLILLVLDSSDLLNKYDLDIIDIVKDKKTIVVVNKTDLREVLQLDQIKKHLHNKSIIRISAKEKDGIDKLEDAIYDMFWEGAVTVKDIAFSNSRHIDAASKALDLVKSSLNSLKEYNQLELCSLDIKDAAQQLGLITGEVYTEELLDSIFSKFCIGK